MKLRSLLRNILQFVPESQRFAMIRSLAAVPNLALDHRFKIEIANTKEDLVRAYQLLHDSYVEIKIMKPHSSGMRCNFYSLLPQTTTIVAKFDDKIVGTVSLIRDSTFGLPSDQDFGKENDLLRAQGKCLVEVSALAVSRKFRDKGHAVSLLLMKYLYDYGFRYFKSNSLICTVHPRAADFYRSLWDFRRNGKIVRYTHAEGALAVHLSMETSTQHEKYVIDSYQSTKPQKNLGLFACQSDLRLKYPKRSQGQTIDPVITPEILEYLFEKKPDLLSELDKAEAATILNIYASFFGLRKMTNLKNYSDLACPTREFRTPVTMTACLNSESQTHIVRILDISSGGCFLHWPSEADLPKGSFNLHFRIGSKTYHKFATVAWVTDTAKLTFPTGYGVKFVVPIEELGIQIKDWLYLEASNG